MIRMSPDNTNNAATQPRVTSFFDERARRIAADYWSDICSRVTDPEAARILVKYLDENQLIYVKSWRLDPANWK